jgi:Ca-activated chloride channel family protein
MQPATRNSELGTLKRLFLLIVIALLTTSSLNAALLDDHRLREANRYIQQGRPDKAAELYDKIHIKKPFMTYNLGLLEYAKGNTDNAKERFEQNAKLSEAVRDQKFAARDLYNIGTMYLENGDAANAIDYYRKALKNDPKDQDAKYNLELARMLVKLNKQPQQQQKKDKPEQKKDKQKEQKQKQAERVLNSFKQKEQKDLQRQTAGAGKQHVEKDW